MDMRTFPYDDCRDTGGNRKTLFILFEMETKKSERANLEKKRSLFFQTGLLLALGFAFAAFEWQVAPRIADIKWELVSSTDGDEIIIARTFHEPPPPPAPPQPTLDLEIVTYDVPVDDGKVDFDWERGENLLPTHDFKPIEIIDEPEPPVLDPTAVEILPTFNGKSAEIGFREYIRDNMHYPEIAIQNGIFGKVFVQFVVDQKGNVVDVQVARSADPSLDNEALRLIKSTSGMWTPGKQRDKAVKVRFTFPITFRLQ